MRGSSFLERAPWRDGGVIAAAAKPQLLRQYGVSSDRELMLALASDAEKIALTGISGFRVGAVGLERETGDLILGGNLEFPGQPLAATVHAEQFLFARAFHRGHSIESFALRDPTPCGHCRQFILEFSGGKQIRFYNAGGLDMSIGESLPFHFGPEQLGEMGAVPNADLGLRAPGRLTPLATAALGAANASHAPYSRTPAGIALRTKDGEIIPGSGVESAAFNPSLPPLQSALINLVASGRTFKDIRQAVLAQVKGAIDHLGFTRALLKQVAPQASVSTVALGPRRRRNS